MKRVLFEYLAFIALIAVAAGLCCCAPSTSRVKSAEQAGTYQMSRNRLYDDDGDFSLLKNVVYAKTEGTTFNSDLNVSNKTLTCTSCLSRSRLMRDASASSSVKTRIIAKPPLLRAQQPTVPDIRAPASQP